MEAKKSHQKRECNFFALQSIYILKTRGYKSLPLGLHFIYMKMKHPQKQRDKDVKKKIGFATKCDLDVELWFFALGTEKIRNIQKLFWVIG